MGFKPWAYLAILTLALGALKWGHSIAYKSGWNAAVVSQTNAIHEAETEAVAKARQEWENTTVIAAAEIVVEERIVEVVRVIEKEIPIVVERIVEIAPECNDLGADFAGLLNAQTRSGSNTANGRSDTPAKPD